MFIQIKIPDELPEGHRSSFKKGIAEALIKAATTKSDLEHTPEGHDSSREHGKKVGNALNKQIQNAYPK